MKSINLVIFLFLPTIVFAATSAERAVKETNYAVRTGYQNSDFGDNYAASGRLTVPVSRLGGLSLSADYDRLEGGSGVLDSDSYGLAGVAFLRNPAIGKLSLGYSYAYTQIRGLNNAPGVDDSSVAKNYSAAGEIYYRRFSLSLSRTYADLEDAENVKGVGLGGSFYMRESIRLGVSAFRADRKLNYRFGIAYQPALLHNTTELSVSYADAGDDNDVYAVSLAYFFDKHPTLIDRDRNYR